METELERELPVRLRQSLPAALDVYPAQCPDCGLAMHRHHNYRRSIMTGYGAVELPIPVFRCGGCRRLNSGADLLGTAERYRRHSKKTTELAVKPAALGLSYAAASGGVGGGAKRVVSLVAAGAAGPTKVGGPGIGAG